MSNNIDVNVSDIYDSLCGLVKDHGRIFDTDETDELYNGILKMLTDSGVDENTACDKLSELLGIDRLNAFRIGFKAAFSLMKDINKQLGD